MGSPIEKYLSQSLVQALEEYEAAVTAARKVDLKTVNSIYMRGAKDFVHFLKTGRPLKRDERA